MPSGKVFMQLHFRGFLYALSKPKLRSPRFTTNFLTTERWSHGSNRLQIDADSKLLTEFLSCLQADTARFALEVSSLGNAQATSMNSGRLLLSPERMV